MVSQIPVLRAIATWLFLLVLAVALPAPTWYNLGLSPHPTIRLPSGLELEGFTGPGWRRPFDDYPNYDSHPNNVAMKELDPPPSAIEIDRAASDSKPYGYPLTPKRPIVGKGPCRHEPDARPPRRYIPPFENWAPSDPQSSSPASPSHSTSSSPPRVAAALPTAALLSPSLSPEVGPPPAVRRISADSGFGEDLTIGKVESFSQLEAQAVSNPVENADEAPNPELGNAGSNSPPYYSPEEAVTPEVVKPVVSDPSITVPQSQQGNPQASEERTSIQPTWQSIALTDSDSDSDSDSDRSSPAVSSKWQGFSFPWFWRKNPDPSYNSHEEAATPVVESPQDFKPVVSDPSATMPQPQQANSLASEERTSIQPDWQSHASTDSHSDSESDHSSAAASPRQGFSFPWFWRKST